MGWYFDESGGSLGLADFDNGSGRHACASSAYSIEMDLGSARARIEERTAMGGGGRPSE